MNHVSLKITRILRWILLVYCLQFLVGYAYVKFVGHSSFAETAYTLELASLVTFQYIVEIFSSLVLFRRDPWIRTIVTFGFAFLETFIIIETTGVYRSPYAILGLLLIFLSGIFGKFGPPATVFIYIFGFLISIDGILKNTNNSIIGGLIFLAGALIIASGSYRFWRRFYDNYENPALQNINQSLKSGQQQSSIIIKAIADGVIVFDNNGIISLINPAAALMAEWDVEDCIGIDIHLVIKLNYEDGKEIEKDDDPFKQAIFQGKHVNKSLHLTSKNGKQMLVSLVVSPINVGDKNEIVGGVVVLRDFTAEREAQNRQIDFISTASHEMRTPVAAIEGYLSLAMNDKVANIDSKAREYLEKAHISTQHLGQLFQDLLTSSRAEDGRLVSHPQIIEMGTYIERVYESFSLAAQKKNLQVEFNPMSENADGSINTGKVVKPLYYVHVDPDRIQEVLTNLFDNAVKYTATGKITIGLSGDNEHVYVSIKDTGAGIPAEDIPHLFQKFYRVDSSEVRTIGGTGLGLFICKNIVELYGGKIWVESVLGEGSTFYIALPRFNTQQAEALKFAETTRDQVASTK